MDRNREGEPRRVVITGLGVVSALGNNRHAFWEGISQGRCGIDRVTLFDVSGYRSQLGGQVKDLEPGRTLPRKIRKRMSRCDQMGLLAASEALEDAGLPWGRIDRTRFGIVVGAGAGGMSSAESFYEGYYRKGPRRAHPIFVFPTPPNVVTDWICLEYGLEGPRSTVVTACSSSATSIGYAADLIRYDGADLALGGGSDAMCRLTFAGFNSLRALDEVPCRPFDAERKGISLGEGSAFLLLEELKHALGRRARIYGEFLGYGISCDAYHMTAPDSKGEGAAKAMSCALQDAGIAPEAVDYVNAHGTGTQYNDLVETVAIKAVFGEHAFRLPVSSTKSMVGHCLGSAGSIEAAATLLAIYHQTIPPTIHYEHKDKECD
ncbi:MAG: beta-ketoacyl-[acyl-carrier-protein] synthase family protein, partial [candidate division NC10 bacterium]|nr:beta-ketoacyl-[acyl-carrier-protein] synthase family protein [candidate division NC10 bacterium]